MMRYLVITSIVLSLSACNAGEKLDPVPALMTAQSQEGHAEIKRILSSVTGQKNLPLAQSLFSSSSILSLEKSQTLGKDLAMPLRFQLLKQGENCLLEKMGTTLRWPLSSVKCAAKPR